MAVDPDFGAPGGMSGGQSLPHAGAESRPAFRREGLGWVWEPTLWPGLKVRTDRIAVKSHDVIALIHAYRRGLDRGGQASWTEFFTNKINLLAAQTRDRNAKQIFSEAGGESEAGGGPLSGAPWAKWSLDFARYCRKVVELETAPIAPQRVAPALILPGSRTADLIAGIIPAGLPSSIYAPGSTGKSFLAAAFAVCVALGLPFAGRSCQRGTPLYLDWEDSFERFAERVSLICRGLGLSQAPPLLYQACSRPLAEEFEAIAELVDRELVDFVVIDSVEQALGTTSQWASMSEVVKELHASLDRLSANRKGAITTLLLDHVSAEGLKEGRKTSTLGKPIGVIQKVNRVRNSWELRKSQGIGARTWNVSLFHAKTNHTMLSQPIHLEVDFGVAGRVVFAPAADVDEELAEVERKQNGRLVDQIAHCLREQPGPLGAKEIAAKIGAPIVSTRSALNRHVGLRFSRLQDDAGEVTWELVKTTEQPRHLRLLEDEPPDAWAEAEAESDADADPGDLPF